MLTVAHSLWSLGGLVKCLSGAIKFEYRIRPDWQDTVFLLASGFINRGSVYDFLQRALAFTYRGLCITKCCHLLLTCVCGIIYVMVSVSKGGCVIVLSREDLWEHPLPAFIPAHWQSQHQHHELLSVIMGSMILLGVFALSVSRREGRVVLAAGVQLRQQGARVMSNKLKDIVFGEANQII